MKVVLHVRTCVYQLPCLWAMYAHTLWQFTQLQWRRRCIWRCFTWKSKDQVWTKHGCSEETGELRSVCWIVDTWELLSSELCHGLCSVLCARERERVRERELHLIRELHTCCFPGSSANLLSCVRWQCWVTDYWTRSSSSDWIRTQQIGDLSCTHRQPTVHHYLATSLLQCSGHTATDQQR